MKNNLTDSLHDYVNMLLFLQIAASDESLFIHEVAFSDIKGNIIESYPEQVINSMIINKQEEESLLLAMQEEIDFEDD